MIHTEAAFESVGEQSLLAGGYVSLAKDGFDTARAIFPAEVLDFIRTTQRKDYDRVVAILKDKTDEQILSDLVKWLDTYGSLATIRHGFKCYGRTFRVAFFRPAHGLNPDLEGLYNSNRVGLTRQLAYSARNANTLDLTISLNGIPVGSLELKNPITGQTVQHAIWQYQHDRDPREPIFEFKRRTLVHFAADPDEVYMTTKLAGKATHFLPFNKGNGYAAGNPPGEPGKYRTSYLWEEALQRDSLLDILARFLHLQVEEKRTDTGQKIKKESMIFPRYHQLRAVRNLEAASREEGTGHNYLIEHSAGSGKSNTIAWTAHRLSSLHNDKDERVFDTVVVVTDRRVLDQQLQDTIYQFEHKQGVVQKIDQDSKQLLAALRGGTPIVITTLQKFPVVAKVLADELKEGKSETAHIPSKRYAVIIDEAHSSQGGDAATELKGVLGGEALAEEAQTLAKEEGEESLAELFRKIAQRGKQTHISFYAFTATPKHKTFAVFGRDKEPFDKYAMRQAIEEGFILDVLKSYTTYAVYYRLLQETENDPEVERKKAAKALARFFKLHPYNIAQKTEVMIEHFNAVTRHKIGGMAKAMVVTDSRLAAARYKLAFDKYIQDKGYSHIRTLVAFSGTVVDDQIPDSSFTEVGMNKGIKEGELPERFATPDYQVLIVADKYQTGFDQPLLHTMYVDKRLSGIQAVQTLSRLNRTHPLKEDTFVLDFVNDREEIQASFKQYYEGAEMGELPEPSRMYELKAELDDAGIYRQEEIDRFVEIFFAPKKEQSAADHQKLNSVLDPAVDRFKEWREKDEDEAELWRGKMNAFRNLYSFLSQIIPYQDTDLEKLFSFLRFFAPKLPRKTSGPGYSFDDDIRLKYYRHQLIAEGSIDLSEGLAAPVVGPTATGTGLVREERVRLSHLVGLINDRFGTDLTEADQLFFDQLVEDATGDATLALAASVNPEDKFSLMFEGHVENLMVERMDQNEELFAKYMSDPTIQRLVNEWLAAEVYRKFKQPLRTEEVRSKYDL